VTSAARLLRTGSARSIIAESVLFKQQPLIVNRSRQRGPNLRTTGRIVAGWCALLMRASRVIRAAIIPKPLIILGLYRSLVKRK
jgi:hypothetical protein